MFSQLFHIQDVAYLTWTCWSACSNESVDLWIDLASVLCASFIWWSTFILWSTFICKLQGVVSWVCSDFSPTFWVCAWKYCHAFATRLAWDGHGVAFVISSFVCHLGAFGCIHCLCSLSCIVDLSDFVRIWSFFLKISMQVFDHRFAQAPGFGGRRRIRWGMVAKLNVHAPCKHMGSWFCQRLSILMVKFSVLCEITGWLQYWLCLRLRVCQWHVVK